MFGIKDQIMERWARADSIDVRIIGKIDILDERQKNQEVLQSKIRDEDLEARERFHERFNRLEGRMDDVVFLESHGDSAFMHLLEGRLIGVQQDFQLLKQDYHDGQKIDSVRAKQLESELEMLRYLMTAPPETVMKYIEKEDKDRWWNPKDWID
jgi:hypothetical protein